MARRIRVSLALVLAFVVTACPYVCLGGATLTSRSWMAVGEAVAGTGGMLRVLDNAPMDGNAFYRIQLVK